MLTILWLGMSYVIGAIPFGLVLTKMRGLPDPRLHGSKNMGATNVARVCGTGCGATVLVLDILKGLFAVGVASSFSESWLFLSLTALAVLLGHMYSVFVNGEGGKGVATTVGVFLGLTFWPAVLALIVCLTVIKLGGFVSLGSLVLVTLMPIFMLLTENFNLLPITLVIMALVYSRHKDNIQRLAKGEEQSWRTCA
ncbi:glycerol-3-phosphate 1-O-acyltransferase PlsY [Desulfonatronum thioautotrophicum]|uniref:glycerol-3-phosphate 1-O-acyltransferase PlsY n=1 Tax=Desulfonatronum thioautotrophicum TaxID=617001 RepID=UPI0005EB859C|nr:glycerol-3-phosphate 1-O-acyltransferase PlsY [Desulfonatronum thioautotrophicum]